MLRPSCDLKMLETWEDRRLIARLVAEVVVDRLWSWTIVRAKSVAASCSKFLSWDFKSQRDLAWPYHQCFMITAPIVYDRKPLIEKVPQLVVQLVVPPIVRHQYRWYHDWSYLSSSPIISNRTLTRTINRGERLQMEIKWRSSEASPIGRTTNRDSL